MKNTLSSNRFLTLLGIIAVHIVVYGILLTYFRTRWNILIYGVALASIIFLVFEGYRFRREIRMAYISSFFCLGMVFGLAFFTTWLDKYFLCIGFIALQMGIFKFLAARLVFKIPFKGPSNFAY